MNGNFSDHEGDISMYCPNCGTSIDKNAEVCVNCGVNVLKLNTQTIPMNDRPNIWVNLLSLCCIPLLGIIMFFVWKEKQPKAAKSALIFGLIGLFISIIFSIIMFLLGFAAEMMNDSYYY